MANLSSCELEFAVCELKFTRVRGELEFAVRELEFEFVRVRGELEFAGYSASVFRIGRN
ncbi:MAG: hypothetical protein GY820_26890 [Gammaproteobacteria bacterium]|nr:hypothetical protein [Gammaproteobacteria bacterium]